MTNTNELVAEFADCVSAQSRAVLSGDSDQGDEFARRYIEAFRSLRTLGNAGRDALAALLTDERADVRIMAASFLLRHSGERARQVLEREATGRGLLALSAAQALRRWDEGTWEIDLE